MNFFRGNAKFPRFKSKKKKNSFTVPQFAKLEGGRFYAPKFKEGIKVNIHREVKGEIGKCTLSSALSDLLRYICFTRVNILSLGHE